MRFIWFLNFWGWCRETYRAEMLLRHPLEGIAANWDEWFSGEATDTERAEVDYIGQEPELQAEFLRWLGEVWIKDAVTNGNQLALDFVRRELGRVSPFDRWSGFGDVEGSAARAIAAVVLHGENDSKAEDVMRVRTTLLPLGRADRGRVVVAEGFDADEGDLQAARASVLQLLRGRSSWRMFGSWIANGRRPHPAWLQALLAAGWLAAGGILAWLLFGPDPGDALRTLSVVLVAIWTVLVLVALTTAVLVVGGARRVAKSAAKLFAEDQVRVGLERRLLVKGGSAGLPFALGILQAVARAYPATLSRAWFWRQYTEGVQMPDADWAATGILTANGQVQPVELTAKIRSCLKHPELSALLVPNQREADKSSFRRLTEEAKTTLRSATGGDSGGKRRLKIYRCRSLAEAVATVSNLSSLSQRLVGGLALIVSALMIGGATDLRCIIFPPPEPVVVPPSSPSPYFLWVSLDTPYPSFFQVVLQSRVWANRRADVAFQESLPSSVRAEIHLVRLTDSPAHDLQQGLVSIERRPSFLFRKFQPGEVVGSYTLPYLNSLRHDK